MAAPMRKTKDKPMREYRRPKRSLSHAAPMAPKKHPAVSSDTTLEETEAFFESAKPDESVGKPKSLLKDLSARMLPMTPVS